MAKDEKPKETELKALIEAVHDDIVVVHIGPNKIKYSLHAGLLAKHSEYFKAALNGPWEEAEERVITLDDVDCETFNVFVKWLYTQKLPPRKYDWHTDHHKQGEKIDEDSDDEDSEDSQDSDRDKRNLIFPWMQFELLRVKAYVFGDRFLAKGFRCAVRNHLVNEKVRHHRRFFYSTIKYGFANLPSDDILLRLMVHLQCSYWRDGVDTEDNGELKRRDELPTAFLTNVMVRYSDIIRKDISKSLSKCDYHEHSNEEERNECEEKQD